MSDYFYGQEACRYSFFRMPKALFFDEKYKNLSTDAKVLYGVFLDRMGLSEKNHWLDDQNRVFIVYTMEEIEADLNCGHQKAIKMVAELAKYDLIERKRQGMGKPNLIYVKDFVSEVRKSYFKKYENHTSGSMKIKLQEVRKSYPNNTEYINTDLSETYPILSVSGESLPGESDEMDEMGVIDPADQLEEVKVLEEYFRDEAGIDILLQEKPEHKEIILGIWELLVETCASTRKSIVIAGEERPMVLVRNRLMKLNLESIRYVLGCMEKNTTEVKNIRQYLLAALYNAPVTMGAYYQSKVNSDMMNGTYSSSVF